MNAGFIALAFTSALNPKLLALDLLLIENRRPRAMFLCVLPGGMTVAVAIGLLDVLTVHADAITAQGKASAGVDLALGAAAARRRRAARDRPPARRQQAPVPAATGPPEKPEKKDSAQASHRPAMSWPSRSRPRRPAASGSPWHNGTWTRIIGTAS